MSSSIDAGKTADEASRIRKTPCKGKKAKNKKHKWVEKGAWPSTWSTCEHCNVNVYSK